MTNEQRSPASVRAAITDGSYFFLFSRQELEARLQAEAFNAESAKTVQTALSVEEQVDENELAVQYLGKQAERERTRSQVRCVCCLVLFFFSFWCALVAHT